MARTKQSGIEDILAHRRRRRDEAIVTYRKIISGEPMDVVEKELTLTVLGISTQKLQNDFDDMEEIRKLESNLSQNSERQKQAETMLVEKRQRLGELLPMEKEIVQLREFIAAQESSHMGMMESAGTIQADLDILRAKVSRLFEA